MQEMKVVIFGSGPMAEEYAKVLLDLKVDFEVVGNTSLGAVSFKERTGIDASTGGSNLWVSQRKNVDNSRIYAIVAVNEHLLGTVSKQLLSSGVKTILIEKPGGLDFKDIREVNALAKVESAEVYVGYNRRFLSSVISLKERLSIEGGVKSFHFDFTERSYIIEALQKDKGTFQNWFIQNSSHVIDLAFYLGGLPKSLECSSLGESIWHKNPMIFVGHGTSNSEAAFSYHANWNSAGRWSLEFCTDESKYFLCPMEKLKVQRYGSMEIDELVVDNALDLNYKPGLFNQVKLFMERSSELLTIQDQDANLWIYEAILKGTNLS